MVTIAGLITSLTCKTTQAGQPGGHRPGRGLLAGSIEVPFLPPRPTGTSLTMLAPGHGGLVRGRLNPA